MVSSAGVQRYLEEINGGEGLNPLDNCDKNDLVARTNSAYHLSVRTTFLKVYPVSSSTRRRTERWYAIRNTFDEQEGEKSRYG